jgi:hypothetical protein
MCICVCMCVCVSVSILLTMVAARRIAVIIVTAITSVRNVTITCKHQSPWKHADTKLHLQIKNYIDMIRTLKIFINFIIIVCVYTIIIITHPHCHNGGAHCPHHKHLELPRQLRPKHCRPLLLCNTNLLGEASAHTTKCQSTIKHYINIRISLRYLCLLITLFKLGEDNKVNTKRIHLIPQIAVTDHEC